MEGEKDVANFVLESGSGNQIPDPFDFVNYSPPDTIPSASSQPTSRIAEFTRSTLRETPLMQNSMPLALKEGPMVNATEIGDKKGATTSSRRNDLYVGGSVVDAASQSITVPSKAHPIPHTNDIQLTASMTNQNGGLDPLKRPLEQLQNAISTSQNARRPLPIPPTVILSIIPKSEKPSGVEVAQAFAGWQPAFDEYMSPSQKNRTARKHALSLNQISTGGDGGGTRLPAETPHHHDPNSVWRPPSHPLPQAVDDVVDSDEAEESGGYYYCAVDESEVRMPVVLPQTLDQLNLFLKQHEQNSLHSNVDPISFLIKKTMKSRRTAHRTHSTSGSSVKLDTDSFTSRSSD
jgi:hypothetical protein